MTACSICDLFRVGDPSLDWQGAPPLIARPSVMAQVFVVVAAGSVIAFIIRDVGDASLAGWIIQASHFQQVLILGWARFH
jgi:hypothetical protein